MKTPRYESFFKTLRWLAGFAGLLVALWLIWVLVYSHLFRSENQFPIIAAVVLIGNALLYQLPWVQRSRRGNYFIPTSAVWLIVILFSPMVLLYGLGFFLGAAWGGHQFWLDGDRVQKALLIASMLTNYVSLMSIAVSRHRFSKISFPFGIVTRLTVPVLYTIWVLITILIGAP